MYHRQDKLGRPIYIERVGHLKIKKLWKVTTEDRMLRYYIRSYERMVKYVIPACSKQKGELVQQTMIIVDMHNAGISMASRKVYRFIKLASTIAQDYYPEYLGK